MTLRCGFPTLPELLDFKTFLVIKLREIPDYNNFIFRKNIEPCVCIPVSSAALGTPVENYHRRYFVEN